VTAHAALGTAVVDEVVAPAPCVAASTASGDAAASGCVAASAASGEVRLAALSVSVMELLMSTTRGGRGRGGARNGAVAVTFLRLLCGL